MTRRPRVISVFLALALVVVVGGCTGGDDEETSPTITAPSTTTTEATTTSTEPPDEDQVRAVVEGWYQVRVEASLTSTYDSVEVRALVDGEVLESFEDNLAQRAADGVRSRRPDPDPSRFEILDVAVDGDTASARECGVDALIRFVEATGEVQDDRILTYVRRSSLERVDGGWRIVATESESSVEGVQPCPES